MSSDPRFSKLVELAAEIRKQGTSPPSFRPRWEFGREVERLFGKRVFLRDEAVVLAETSITRTTYEDCLWFFRKFPNEIEIPALMVKYRNWSSLRRPVCKEAYSLPPVYGILRNNLSSSPELFKLATGKTHSVDYVLKVFGVKKSGFRSYLLPQLTMLPWLTVWRDHDQNFTFTIDHELKEICDRHQPGAVNELSLADHLANLRKEIRERRERNNCDQQRRKWNPDNILKMELIRILDFVEEELDKIPSTTTRLAKLKSTVVEPNEQRPKEAIHDQQKEREGSSVDAGTSEDVRGDETTSR